MISNFEFFNLNVGNTVSQLNYLFIFAVLFVLLALLLIKLDDHKGSVDLSMALAFIIAILILITDCTIDILNESKCMNTAVEELNMHYDKVNVDEDKMELVINDKLCFKFITNESVEITNKGWYNDKREKISEPKIEPEYRTVYVYKYLEGFVDNTGEIESIFYKDLIAEPVETVNNYMNYNSEKQSSEERFNKSEEKSDSLKHLSTNLNINNNEVVNVYIGSNHKGE